MPTAPATLPALLRGLAAIGLAGLLSACAASDCADENIAGLRLIGEHQIRTGTLYQGEEFGGISAIDRAADGRYWALSDERGGDHGSPRFYALDIDFDANAINAVRIAQMVYLKDAAGTRLPGNARTVDPEGLRVAPNGNLYISSEGNFASGADLHQPFVREYKTDGSLVRDFEIPPAFLYVDNRSSGARNNKSFEALALTPGAMLFVATEDALIQDGPAASLQSASVLRVLQLDPASARPLAQYAYTLPPIPLDKAADGSFAPDNGLTDLLALSNTQFIAVERAYADGVGNTIRLVLASIEPDSTDVQALPSLVGASYKPLKKRLLLEMPVNYRGVKLDNIEGATWGPRLANGHRTLVLVADNNFSQRQSTQFLAFEVLPE